MFKVLPLAILLLLVACVRLSEADAKHLAAAKLSELADGPSVKNAELESRLSATRHDGGNILVEFEDKQRNTLWAVVVSPTGESEVSRAALDEST